MAHLRAVLNSTNIPLRLLTFDRDMAVIFVSASLLEILQIEDHAAIVGVPVSGLLNSSHVLQKSAAAAFSDACRFAVASSGNAARLKIAFADHPDGDCEVVIDRLADSTWCATFMSRLQRPQPDLDDPIALLSGFATRRIFIKQLNIALAHRWVSQPDQEQTDFAVILINLDRFRHVNDTHGHSVGDTLLCLVANRLRATAKESDLVAYMSGDEFAVIVSAPRDHDGLKALAEDFMQAASHRYVVGGQTIEVTASIGIAVAPDDGNDADRLLQSAEIALHAAKHAGRRACRFFEPAMEARALSRVALENDLRKAMLLQEFELHFQPQVDLHSRAIAGFEALLRWRHPERGLVGPNHFVSIMEESGMIVPLGEWVLRAACREAMAWPLPLSVAVNVSARQLEQSAGLVEAVAQALAAAGLPGPRLEIEVAGTALLFNEPTLAATLHRLRAMGVRIAIDNVGVGDSALEQLRAFPFDKIKIDRSLLLSAGGSGRNDATMQAIAAIGASLGVTILAEGVETASQLTRVRADGCTSAQGYFVGRAVLAEQVADLVANFTLREKVLSEDR